MIYEYKCHSCGEIIEKMQSHNEVGNFNCECGGIKQRYFSPASAQAIQCLGFISKPHFDLETGRYMDMSEIRAIEKSGTKIFESHDNIRKECEKNRARNIEAIEEDISSTVGRICGETVHRMCN